MRPSFFQELALIVIALACPHCHSAQVGKGGKTSTGKQRQLRQNERCIHRTLILDYSHWGRQPQVKGQIVDMAPNGRGISDTARALGISKDTVLISLSQIIRRHRAWRTDL